MARPSQHIDQKLIAAGKKKLIENGLSGISIRSICLESGINLGMFHYYFRSKENFIKILFQGLSDDLQSYWIKESAGLSTSREKLEKVLFMSAKMMKEKKRVFETILKDIDFCDEFYIQLGKDIQRKWGIFYYNLVEDCKKEGFLDKNVDGHVLVAVIAGGMSHYAKGRIDHGNESNEEYYAALKEVFNMLMEKFK